MRTLLPIIGLLSIGFSTPAAANVILSITPSSQNVVSGGFSSARIDIFGVMDLFSFQADLFFTPGFISANSLTEGAFLGSNGDTTDFFAGTIDNTAGSIAGTFSTIFGSGPGITGVGVLARVDFSNLRPGTSILSLDNIVLDDSLGNAIAFDLPTTSQIVVNPPTQVPEPSTYLLLGSGIAFVCWKRWKPLQAAN